MKRTYVFNGTTSNGKFHIRCYTQDVIPSDEGYFERQVELRQNVAVEAARPHRVLSKYDKRILHAGMTETETRDLRREVFCQLGKEMQRVMQKDFPEKYTELEEIWHIVYRGPSHERTEFMPYPDQVVEVLPSALKVPELHRVRVRHPRGKETYVVYRLHRDAQRAHKNYLTLYFHYADRGEEGRNMLNEMSVFLVMEFAKLMKDTLSQCKREGTEQPVWLRLMLMHMGDVFVWDEDDWQFTQVLEEKDWDCPMRTRTIPFTAHSPTFEEMDSLYQDAYLPYDKEDRVKFNQQFVWVPGEMSNGDWVDGHYVRRPLAS
jgi:hypothetical protein